MIHCHIITYNRPEKCLQLAKKLTGCDLSIYDDGSTEDYSKVEDHIAERVGSEILYYDHGGKEFFWALWNAVIRNSKGEYNIYLPDDVTVSSTFVEDAVSEFNRIKKIDRRAVTLNLLLDKRREGKSCWTRFDPYQTDGLWHTQWVDGCFVADSTFKKVFGYLEPPPPVRFVDPNMSSGVGEQMSKRLNNAGLNMYQVLETMVSHGDHESKMHPELRKRIDLKT